MDVTTQCNSEPCHLLYRVSTYMQSKQAMEVAGVEVKRQTFLTPTTYEELTVLRFIWFTDFRQYNE